MSTEVKAQQFAHFINGEWTASADRRMFDVINPFNGQTAAQVAMASEKDVDLAVRNAKETYESGIWSKKSKEERAGLMLQFASKVKENAQQLIYLEGISSGATIRKLAAADIRQLVMMLRQTANASLTYNQVETLPLNDILSISRNQVIREPVGVVAAITPWNFPLVLAMWKIAPALAMGNSIVLKPASDTPLGSLLLAQLAVEAGIPKGVLNVVAGKGSEAGEALVRHPDVNKIAFTGSTEVGKTIMKQAADTVKKVTLELGGKSAAIVMPDADLEVAIPGILFGVFFHSGQVCESGTRLIVHESIYDTVIEQLVHKTEDIKLGDPMQMSTGMGPLVSKKQLDTVLSYIESGKEEGARLVCGGKRAEGKDLENGYFVEPTIFADVTNDMKIAREEIFGPVLCVMKYSDEKEAVAMANDSIYGLAGGIWSRDVNKANELALQMEAGTIWINDWHMFRNDAPFGGYKQSGIGRELGTAAFDEYTQTKHIHTSLATENSQRPALGLLF